MTKKSLGETASSIQLLCAASPSGTWLPSKPSSSPFRVCILLVLSSIVASMTFGYDSSMLNGLNILPSYSEYFQLNDTTTGLQTASLFIGGCIACTIWGFITDALGRRPALLCASVVTLVGVALQTASINLTMFTCARIVVGFGTVASQVSGPIYLAEALPTGWRALGLGALNNCFIAGSLLAAGITYGSSKLSTTWAWRLPSLLQSTFSIISMCILPFVPESPRWLLSQGLHSAARAALKFTLPTSESADEELRRIEHALRVESLEGPPMNIKSLLATRSVRKRVWIASSSAVFGILIGNTIASYYLGPLLEDIGITSNDAQLKINVILNSWCLILTAPGTWLVERSGRKSAAIGSTILCTILLFLLGVLISQNGSSARHSEIYGTVAVIFLFQGAWASIWTPLLFIYPPEVLQYSIRAIGMGLAMFCNQAFSLLIVYTMPIALERIGWKVLLINGAWDVVLIVVMVLTWIETKGTRLEDTGIEIMRASQ